MRQQLQISRIEDMLQWLEVSSNDITGTQSVGFLVDHIGQLCNCLAFSNGQMAIAKSELNKAKVNAYNTLILSSHSQQKYFAPSLAKDFVSAQCEKEQYCYDMAERASRTITHILDSLRTCVSALKEEIKISSYQQI